MPANKLMTITNPKDSSAVIILASGWADCFHIIYENPEDGDLHHEYEFIQSDELLRDCASEKMRLKVMEYFNLEKPNAPN